MKSCHGDADDRETFEQHEMRDDVVDEQMHELPCDDRRHRVLGSDVHVLSTLAEMERQVLAEIRKRNHH